MFRRVSAVVACPASAAMGQSARGFSSTAPRLALEMRPNCECCDRDLEPSHAGAHICSFECTFCEDCSRSLKKVCPNCSGPLFPRPPRPEDKLQANPASSTRVRRLMPCFEDPVPGI